MKKQLFILGLFIAGIFVSHAQECDTLKLKVVKSYYAQLINGSNFKLLGELDGAIISIDTLPSFYLGASVVNVSNDTFHPMNNFSFGTECFAYTATGSVGYFWGTINYYFGQECIPNDTINMYVGIQFDLAYMINRIKETLDIDFEEISHWKMIITVGYTDKDGLYSDSVINLSADTSTFYIVKTGVGIREVENTLDVSVFPNPAQSQFTVTNTENATLQLYNILGQQVREVKSMEKNTMINTAGLSAGIYILKVQKGNAVVSKKVQIIE